MEVYENLPALKHGQIRLIRVHSMSESSESLVACTLTTHNLDDAHEKPGFFALSYTWGPPHWNLQEIRKLPLSLTNRILCNEKIVGVSENLHEFLRHCASSQDQSLRSLAWVDALCINQHAIHERSQQVNLMGDIYRAASRVVVWLGVEDISTAAAVDLISGLLLSSTKDRLKLSPHEVKSGHSNYLLDTANWKALACFFQRAWFNRAWIIQEVVFANTAVVLCGSRSFDWEQLIEISQFLATTSWTTFLKDAAIFDAAENAQEQWHNTPARLTATKRTWTSTTNEGLLYALIRARSSSCQDPRDKVYSQLALGKANIFPQYELSVADVYIDAAKYIISHSDSLLILTCVEGEEFQTIPGLPSWVPDWSVTKFLGLRITGYRHFNAAGARPQKCALSTNGDKHILSIEATKLDDIVEICDTKSNLRLNLYKSNLWEMISKLGKTYASTGESCGEAVWRTFVTNRASIASESRVQYPALSTHLEPSFRDWILWRYAIAAEEPTRLPMPTPNDNMLPSKSEVADARQKSLEDPLYVVSLAHRASLFDVHFLHAKLLRPFRTRQGYFGTGTQCLQEGDSVWIIPGCRIPLILRQVENSEHYYLVGGSYVHGVMNGEFLNQPDLVFSVVDLE